MMKSVTILIICIFSLIGKLYAGTCKDNSNGCSYWNGQGYCAKGSKYYGFMQKTCSLTCGFCKGNSGNGGSNNIDSGKGDSNGGSSLGEKYKINAKNIEVILKTHNNYRANVSPSASNMEKMYWDDKLQESAQKHIDSCPSGHDTNAQRMAIVGYGIGIGQNLAWHSAEMDWAYEIGQWHGEVKDFRFGVGSTGGVVGHYTALVKAESNRVGCGYKYCPNHKYKHHYGCNYAFIQSQTKKPYENGQSCSACRNNCKNNLCDCGGLICKNGGKLNLSTCKCDCAGAFSGSDCGICPTSDPADCKNWFKWYDDPCVYSNVQADCPVSCQLC